MDDFDPEEQHPGDVTTAATFARSVGVHRSRINKWVTRGYLDKNGQRVHVHVRGHAWVNGRRVPVYLWADLSDAELATRDRAPLRRNKMIAALQLRDRPHLGHHRAA